MTTKEKSGLWEWLSNPSNRSVLGWLGGGLLAVAGFLWNHIAPSDSDPSKKGGATKTAPAPNSSAKADGPQVGAEPAPSTTEASSASGGGIAVNAGRDVKIDIGQPPADTPSGAKTRPNPDSPMSPEGSTKGAPVTQKAEAKDNGIAVNAGRDVRLEINNRP